MRRDISPVQTLFTKSKNPARAPRRFHPGATPCASSAAVTAARSAGPAAHPAHITTGARKDNDTTSIYLTKELCACPD